MVKIGIDELLIKGKEFYDARNFEGAIKCYEKASRLDPIAANIYGDCANAMLELAKIKKNVSLFEKSLKKYAQAAYIDISYYNNLIKAILDLSKIKDDKSLYLKCIKFYEKEVIKKIKTPKMFLALGGIYLALDQKEEAMEYFKKSGKSFLEIVVSIAKRSATQIMLEVLNSLLDLDKKEMIFFRKATEEGKAEDLDVYKKIYIRSMLIIGALYVAKKEGKSVAHYTLKNTAQQLLFAKSKFRLNAIRYSNDPSEGKVLLNYLFDESKCNNENLSDVGYGAFAGCFSFNHDNLNQFRLYGKENNKEGTGLSLIFKNDFFNDIPTIHSLDTNNDNPKNFENKSNDKDDKFSLFRCLYISPNQSNANKTIQNIEITGITDKKIVDNIKKQLIDLKELVEQKGINPTIINNLLINLRYLIKHIAFKEEQECRIVKILPLTDDNIKETNDFNQMYIEYLPCAEHTEKVYFGPKAEGIELFSDFLQRKGLNIEYEKSTAPLA